MRPQGRQGRRTGVRVQVPPGRLASQRIFSREARRLSPEEVRSWNERNSLLLEMYGLCVVSVMTLPLAHAGTSSGGAPGSRTAGPLQTDLRDHLLMTAMLGALSVSVSGRGDLLGLGPAEREKRKKQVKENNDRNSTAAMTEALYALCEASPDVSLRIAIGEGARQKPGEKGGNPALYAGQVIAGRARSAAGGAPGRREYSVAVDTVEGTTKSTLFDHSSGTLLFVTEAKIPAVPDVYFDKCQIKDVSQVTVADPLERVVEAVMDSRGTHEINLFALDRPRHPIDAMLALGANMRTDTDGDAYPVVGAGLGWGVFPDNLRPLDGVAGNIGGAAEMIASAAGGYYLGVRSTARFCASQIQRWEQRYDLTPEDEAEIKAGGFDPGAVYRIEEMVPGLGSADGALVSAAITDNWHIPGLDAAFVGANFATVAALFIGAAGTAELIRVDFSYRRDLEGAVRALTPALTRILGLPSKEIPAAVRRALEDTGQARRLRHELETSYYTHIEEVPGSASGERRLRLNLPAAEEIESAESIAFLRAVLDAAPDWFA